MNSDFGEHNCVSLVIFGYSAQSVNKLKLLIIQSLMLKPESMQQKHGIIKLSLFYIVQYCFSSVIRSCMQTSQ